MKKIEAIIRKSRFEDVKKALLAADIEWFSYYNVRGEGKMRQARIYRGVMYDTSSIERVLLNIVVRDKNVEPTIAAIKGAHELVGPVIAMILFIMPVVAIYKVEALARFRHRWVNGFILLTGALAVSALLFSLMK